MRMDPVMDHMDMDKDMPMVYLTLDFLSALVQSTESHMKKEKMYTKKCVR